MELNFNELHPDVQSLLKQKAADEGLSVKNYIRGTYADNYVIVRGKEETEFFDCPLLCWKTELRDDYIVYGSKEEAGLDFNEVKDTAIVLEAEAILILDKFKKEHC